jgi:hypothetical protein
MALFRPMIERRRDLAVAAVVFAMTLVTFVAAYAPFLENHAVRGDDFAMIRHSSRFFDVSVDDWFSRGNRDFNITFPELNRSETKFIRPTEYSSVWLDSWLADSPDSRWMLLTSYVGHALCAALVFLVCRRIFRLSTLLSLAGAAIFATSVAAASVPIAVADRGDMLAALFSVGALLVMESYLQRRKAAKLAIIAVLVTLAVFAKEAALALPVVLAAYYLLRSRETADDKADQAQGRPSVRRERIAVLLVLFLPLLAYAIVARRAGVGGNYATGDLPRKIHGVPTFALNPFRFLATAFIPVDTTVQKQLVNGGLRMSLDTTRAAIAVVANLVLLAVLIVCLRARRYRRTLALLAIIALLASGLPLFLKADARFMYLSQTLVVPLAIAVVVAAAERFGSTSRRRRILLAVGLGILLVVGPAYFVVQLPHRLRVLREENRTAAALESAVAEQLTNRAIHRVYLLDVPPEFSPGLPALDYIARRAGRGDVALRVINTLDGPNRSAGTGVSFTRSGLGLRGHVAVGKDQKIFANLSPNDVARLGEKGLIDYAPIRSFSSTGTGRSVVSQRAFDFSIPDDGQADFAIVGLDPGDGRVHVLEPASTDWAPRS